MKRVLLFAAAGLCLTGAAHAQSVSKKYKWDEDASVQSCMEPYAPAVPKPEETSLKAMLDDVKPEVQTFIEESNSYLACLSIQLEKAKEARDQAKIKQLVKAHNDNVQYQESVAGEFNKTLQVLKQEAGAALMQQQTGAESSGDGAASGGEGSQTAEAADAGADNAEDDKKPEN